MFVNNRYARDETDAYWAERVEADALLPQSANRKKPHPIWRKKTRKARAAALAERERAFRVGCEAKAETRHCGFGNGSSVNQ